MGTLLSVGEKYPLFEQNTRLFHGLDGGILEAFPEGEGLIYTLYLQKPSSEEIRLVQERKMSVRLLEDTPYCLPLIQFGSSRMIFEMSFDPTLYPDDRAFQIGRSNNVLTIVLVDSESNTVRALRSANLPLAFIERCTNLWKLAFADIHFSDNYKKWYAQKQKHPLETLWDRAIYLGKLGETFNLAKLSVYQEDMTLPPKN